MMKAQESSNISNADTHHKQESRLQGYQLVLARVVWIAIAVPTYALFIANVPAYFASLHTLHAPNGQPFTVQPTFADVHTLQAWHLSLDFYAIGMVLVSLIFQFSYAGVGVLLFWRKSDNRAALFTSYALMMLPFGFANITLPALPPDWLWLIPTLSSLGNSSLLLCGFVFPNGQFVPRWTRWLAVVMLGYWVVVTVSPSWQLDRSAPSLVLFLCFAVSTVLAQLYRYHYVSTPRERQQTKWAVFGASIALAGNILPRLLYYFVLLPRSQGSPLAYALEISLIMCPMLAIPFTLGIAVLSSRLWEIDVLINRTLVYGTLTGILALIYLGSVFVLQMLFHALTGQVGQSPVLIVSSTLLIAVLFQPLRRRIQRVIDRRFYRHKYNAARTVQAFSTILREELDLNQLSEHLLAVVEETMQPSHVSLWVRTSEWTKERKRRLISEAEEEEG